MSETRKEAIERGAMVIAAGLHANPECRSMNREKVAIHAVAQAIVILNEIESREKAQQL